MSDSLAWRACRPLRVSGARVGVGDVVVLDAATAAPLLAAGVIETVSELPPDSEIVIPAEPVTPRKRRSTP